LPTRRVAAAPIGGPGPLVRSAIPLARGENALERDADRRADSAIQAADPAPRRLRSVAPLTQSAVAAPAIVNDVLGQGGRPLDGAARAQFEPRFGYDFGSVRVHSDARAAAAAEAVGAEAFTVGTNIVFGAGGYRPDSAAGRHLIAHELGHVAQHAEGQPAALRRKVKVGAGLSLDTKGFTTSKTGDTYTAPAVSKSSVWNEIFTSLLHSPRTFTIDGGNNAKLNENFDAHMKARYDITTFAAQKKYTFGAGSSMKMNPSFWEKSGTSWKVKPGVDRQKAVADLNVHPKDYAIACLAATQLTMEGGAKSASMVHGSSADTADWVPGDWGYIKNVKFPSDGSGIVGLEGENIIYVGLDKFWGHFNPGLEYKTLAGWIAEVNSFTPPTEAKLLDQRTYTKVGLA
jgi:hypothetical protein